VSAPGPWPGEPSAGGRAAAVPGTPGTVPAPPATAFHLTWPHARAAEVVEAWQHWAPEAPDEMAASLLLIAPGDVEEPPVANVFGSMLSTESDTRELLDEVVARVGTDPASASLRPASYRDTKRYLAELGDAMAGEDDRLGEGTDEQQVHLHSKSGFFRRPLPREAVESLVENLAEGRIARQSRELDFTPWGGAYNRVPAGATAFAHREELFLIQHAVVTGSDASAAGKEEARRWLGRSWDLVRPWGSGGVYPNWPDPDLEDWAIAYHGANFARLVRAKKKYDPEGFFRFHQSVPHRVPAGSAPANDR